MDEECLVSSFDANVSVDIIGQLLLCGERSDHVGLCTHIIASHRSQQIITCEMYLKSPPTTDFLSRKTDMKFQSFWSVATYSFLSGVDMLLAAGSPLNI